MVAKKRRKRKKRQGRARRRTGIVDAARDFCARNAVLLRFLGFAGALFLAWIVAEQGLIRRGKLSAGLWTYGLAWVILFFAKPRLRNGDGATGRRGDKTLAGSPTRRFAGSKARLAAKRVELKQKLVWAAIITLVIVIAVLMRTHKLDEFPPGCFSDEGWNGLEAVRILEGKEYPLYIERNTQNPAFFFYTLAFCFKFCGISLESVRMVSVISGVLTVLGVYFLLGAMFNRTTGILGALLLAGMRWHVNFSRIGFLGAQAVLLSVLAAIFFIRAAKGRRLSDFILGGAFLALNLYHYIANYLFLVVIALGFLHLLVFRFAFYRRNWLRLCAFAVAFMVVAAPISAHYLKNKGHFMSRASSTTVMKEVKEKGSFAPLKDSVRKHLLMFNYRGDNNGRHNLPGLPMLNPLMSAMAMLGLGLCLFRLRRLEYFFSAAWFGVTLQAGILSLAWEAPQAYRTIGNTVGVVLLCAVYCREFLALLASPGGVSGMARRRNGPGPSEYSRYGLVAALVLAALVSLRLDYGLYFGRQAQDPGSWREFHTMEAEVGRHLGKLEGKGKVFLAPPYYRHPSILFLARGFQEHNRFDIINLSNVLPRRQCPQGAVFILEEVHEWLKGMFDFFYEDYDFEKVNDPWGRTMFTVFRVSGQEIEKAQSLRLRCWRGRSAAGEPLKEKLVGSTRVRAGELPRGDVYVKLSGSFYVPRSGRVGFRLQAGEGDVAVDGKTLGLAAGLEKKRFLYQGFHSLRLQGVAAGEKGIALLWRPPGSGWSELAGSCLCRQGEVRGLRADYYHNVEWKGPAVLRQIDPLVLFRWHIDPLPEVFTTVWRGYLLVPADGEYLFKTRSNDHAWLSIDGRQVLKFDSGVEGVAVGRVRLSQGRHPLELKYLEKGGLSFMEFWWQRPGGAMEIVPTQYLAPY